MNDSRILTCVYCGMEYPQDTPSHGASVLTEHIKVCEKHPMRGMELENKKMLKLITDLVGSDNITELNSMELQLRTADFIPEKDKCDMINSINFLREKLKETEVRE